MNFIKNKRQSIRLFTPILSLLAIATVGSFLGKKRQKDWNLPYPISSKLKYFRIILLIVWFAATVLSVFGLLESEISLFLKKSFGIGFILLSIPFAITTEQFFCRNFCINGAFYGLNNKISKFRIKRSISCIDCGKCDSVCPMGIQVSKTEKVTDNQCITCLACIDNCPKKDAEAIFLK
jgi:polyferredoxin